MGISDKMNQIAGRFNDGVKFTGASIAGWFFKLVTAFTLGLTFSLVGQELIDYGSFSFLLMLTVVFGVSLKLVAKLNLISILIFDLICVLVALLLRMYILVAP